MDILQLARIARPGTSWNLRNGQLEQAIDGTPRVSTPTKNELDQADALYEEPGVLSIEDRLTKLEQDIERSK